MWLPVIRVGNHIQVGVLLNELLAIAVWRFIPIEFGHLALVVDQHLAQGQVSSWDPGFTACFICGSKEHAFRNCPKRSSPMKGKGTKGKGTGFYTGDVYMIQPASSESEHNSPDPRTYVPDQAHPESLDDAALLHVSGDPETLGFGVIDSGATETVGSLPALEFLTQARYEMHQLQESVEVAAVPAKRFKFGNGTRDTSSSCVLIPQRLGNTSLKLQIYTLDCEGVPILVGMKSLRRLRAVIDFSKCLAIFVAVDPALAVPLRRSQTGHLLLDLRQDWTQQGFRLDNVPSSFLSECPKDEETFMASVYVCSEEEQPRSMPQECLDTPHVELHHESAALSVEQQPGMRASLGALASLVALHFHGHGSRPNSDSRLIGASLGNLSQSETQGQNKDQIPASGPGLGESGVRGPAGSAGGQSVQRSTCGSSSRTGLSFGIHGFAMWRACKNCGLRLLYVPRAGCHGVHRKAGPLSKDTVEAVKTFPQEQLQDRRISRAISTQAFGEGAPASGNDGSHYGQSTSASNPILDRSTCSVLNPAFTPNPRNYADLRNPCSNRIHGTGIYTSIYGRAKWPRGCRAGLPTVDLTMSDVPGWKARRDAPAAEILEFQSRTESQLKDADVLMSNSVKIF